MTKPLAAVHLAGGDERSIDSLSVSDDASPRVSGAQFDDESGALLDRLIGQGVAGRGEGIGTDRIKSVAGFALFQMLGKVQGPFAGGSLTNARGHGRRRMPNARSRESAPRRPVERALRGNSRCVNRRISRKNGSEPMCQCWLHDAPMVLGQGGAPWWQRGAVVAVPRAGVRSGSGPHVRGSG